MMTERENQKPPYADIWRLLKKGSIIPVLGPGVSLSGRTSETVWSPSTKDCLPDSSELTCHLADQFKFKFPYEHSLDLVTMAQYVRIMKGRPLLFEWLHSIFDQDYPYASVHELLADVPAHLLVLTTNYDDLLERAFHAHGYPFDLVIYPSDHEEWRSSVLHWKHGAERPEPFPPNRLYIDLDQTTVIYKLHGAINRQDASQDSIVIDDDDYAVFLGRAAAKKVIPAIFGSRLRSRYFLYLGYSLRDWNFRMTLSQIEQDVLPSMGRLPSWAIQRNVSLLEQGFWEKRNVTVYDMEIQEFVFELRKEQAKNP
jgi:hypothetical protein